MVRFRLTSPFVKNQSGRFNASESITKFCWLDLSLITPHSVCYGRLEEQELAVCPTLESKQGCDRRDSWRKLLCLSAAAGAVLALAVPC